MKIEVVQVSLFVARLFLSWFQNQVKISITLIVLLACHCDFIPFILEGICIFSILQIFNVVIKKDSVSILLQSCPFATFPINFPFMELDLDHFWQISNFK